MKMRHSLALIAALVLIAAACGEGTADDPAATTPAPTSPATTSPVTTSPVTTSPIGSDAHALAGTSWVAQQISDGSSSRPVIAGNEPNLDFGPGGGTVSGSTGCNQYSGDVTIGSGTMSIGQVAVTERACLDAGVMDQESLFLAVFTGSGSFTLADGILELQGSAGSVSFAEPEQVVDAALDGTGWTLDTLIDGVGASSVLSTTRPSLRVDLSDVSVRGTTGCNDFGGRVQVQGSAFTVTDMSWTEIGCESGVMTQEAFILGVLQNAEQFEIEGDRLTISDGTGRALVYKAG
jgi:heat shock protein HslJ